MGREYMIIEDLVRRCRDNLHIQLLIVWECPGCGFTFDACHTDNHVEHIQWTCPDCGTMDSAEGEDLAAEFQSRQPGQ
jgi:hypothetical protein